MNFTRSYHGCFRAGGGVSRNVTYVCDITPITYNCLAGFTHYLQKRHIQQPMTCH